VTVSGVKYGDQPLDLELVLATEGALVATLAPTNLSGFKRESYVLLPLELNVATPKVSVPTSRWLFVMASCGEKQYSVGRVMLTGDEFVPKRCCNTQIFQR